jgi:hypothetical protein
MPPIARMSIITALLLSLHSYRVCNRLQHDVRTR